MRVTYPCSCSLLLFDSACRFGRMYNVFYGRILRRCLISQHRTQVIVVSYYALLQPAASTILYLDACLDCIAYLFSPRQSLDSPIISSPLLKIPYTALNTAMAARTFLLCRLSFCPLRQSRSARGSIHISSQSLPLLLLLFPDPLHLAFHRPSSLGW